jgi:hypothetical protein
MVDPVLVVVAGGRDVVVVATLVVTFAEVPRVVVDGVADPDEQAAIPIAPAASTAGSRTWRAGVRRRVRAGSARGVVTSRNPRA